MTNQKKDLKLGKVVFEIGSKPSSSAQKKTPQTPFNMAILGNFSGSTRLVDSSTSPSLKPFKVDIDNFEQAMGKISPHLKMETFLGRLALSFENLEAFHPDSLLQRVGVLSSLVQLTKRLQDPASASQAREEAISLLGKPTGSPIPTTPESKAAKPKEETASSISFEHLLERPAKPSSESDVGSPKSKAESIVDELIKRAAGSADSPAEPIDTGMVSKIEDALGQLLRELLHHPSFQTLEASWRGIDLLVRSINSEEPLNLYLIDLSKEALVQDLVTAQDLTTTQFYRLLVEHSGISWAAFIGDYLFAPTAEDATLLSRLGIIGLAAGAPFIAGVSPELFGLPSFAATPDSTYLREFVLEKVEKAWAELCRAPVAPYLGLALPRFLLRLPYGIDTESSDQFVFEELGPERAHEHYLWGNPAFACGYVLIQAFLANGWKMNPLAHNLIEGLPVHSYTIDGETQMKPCTECWLSESAYDILSNKGLIPLVSIRNRDAVRLTALPSLAQPSMPLAGAWI